MKRTLLLLCIAAMTFFGASAAQAAYPEKPVNYIIPFNPGGESDIFARAQQRLMEKALGQSILIHYKPGGGGALGWQELAKAKPDGYTTSGFNLPHIVLQPMFRKNAGYKTEDIVPVMIFMTTPNVLAVKKDSPYKTFADILKAVKEKPGTITIGGSGSQTASHVGTLLLNKRAGVNFSYIPFGGTGDAMPALMGGHVDALMVHTSTVMSQLDTVRVLAVATEERFKGMPDVPTFKELGYPNYEGSTRGLAVPPGTPKAIIDQLYKVCKEINNTPGFADNLVANGFVLLDMDNAKALEFIKNQQKEYVSIMAELKK
ncbi:tripartite tricarboxylate transporter substrate binding protein [Desulfovibrio sp. OttesenSCG-928-O18]|nr:tripartite tricarboxylate transporter substrate binding protein [Desulfovibrio sp. OttesenSCG-928-O18]